MAPIKPTHEGFQGDNYDHRWQISNAKVKRQDPDSRRQRQSSTGTIQAVPEVNRRRLRPTGEIIPDITPPKRQKKLETEGLEDNETDVSDYEEETYVSNVQTKTSRIKNIRRSANSKLVNNVSKIAGSTTKRVALGTVWAWSANTYLFLLLPIAILSNIAVGLVIAINYAAAQLGISYENAQSTAELAGVLPDFDYMLLMGVCYLLLAFLHYLFMAFIYLHCKALFCKPLNGGFKTATFLVSAILIWIPIVNIFPLYWIWLANITLNPK